MYLFSASYDPMQDVKIATCMIVCTNEYGKTWILVFNEVFWFGTSMDHLLINPNQTRMVGIPVSEDHFGENLKLGIAHEKLFNHFGTDVTTVYFDSRVPTHREIMYFNHIVMTGNTEWDPQLVQLASVHTKEEEQSHKIRDIAQAPKVH